jgi:hypothetical protein
MNGLDVLTGRRFGRLVVIERGENDRFRHVSWRVRCDCGKERTVLALSLRSGNTRSCGCLLSESSRKRMIAWNA